MPGKSRLGEWLLTDSLFKKVLSFAEIHLSFICAGPVEFGGDVRAGCGNTGAMNDVGLGAEGLNPVVCFLF